MFHDTVAFDVRCVDDASKREVLCVGYAIDKQYLAWPLSISFGLAVVTAVVAGTMTHNVSSGSELGGLVGVAIVLLWTYLLWLVG